MNRMLSYFDTAPDFWFRSRSKSERFWFGPLKSKALAEKICRYAAIGFLACGILLIVGKLWPLGLVVATLAFLLRTQYRFTAACILAALSAVDLAIFLYFIASACYSPTLGILIYPIIGVAVFWTLMLSTALCTCSAARHLRTLARDNPSA